MDFVPKINPKMAWNYRNNIYLIIIKFRDTFFDYRNVYN